MQLDVTVPSWAEAVVSDLTDMDRNPHPVDAASVRRFRIPLPDDAYFEYAFLDGEGRMRADPARSERAENPWYPEVTAVRGPSYRPDPLAALDPGRATGEMRRLRVRSAHLGDTRGVRLYLPAEAPGPLPLLLVQDGTAYARIGRLPAVLEALREEGRARPAAVAFLDPGDRDAEYAFGDAFRAFVWEEALPALRDEIAVSDELHLLGASLGGLASLLLALDRPEDVAGLATQSGAFLGTPTVPDAYRAEASWVLDEVARRPALPWRAYLEVGTMEWLTDVNRRLSERLSTRVPDHAHAERSAGHNWTHWRDLLPEALAFLLAPGSRQGAR